MTDQTIDLSKLSRETLAALVLHWKERFEVVLAATNTLTSILQETGELPGSCSRALDEWAAFVRAAIARSDQEIGRIAGKTPPANSVN